MLLANRCNYLVQGTDVKNYVISQIKVSYYGKQIVLAKQKHHANTSMAL